MGMSRVTVADVNAFLEEDFPAAEHRCVDIGYGWAVASLATQPWHVRPGSIVSGPAIFGLCDAALYFAVFSIAGVTPMAVTSDFSVRFVNVAKGDVLTARATIDKPGKRTVVGTVRAWTTDESWPVAVAQGTYSMPPAEPHHGWQ